MNVSTRRQHNVHPFYQCALHDLPLFRNRRWAEEIVVTIFPYDAGTDSGLTYTSPNARTTRPEPIALLQAPPVLVDGEVPPMGAMTFRRTDLTCEVRLDQSSYADGDTIATEMLQLGSLRDDATTVEVGIWFQAPEAPPVSLVNDVLTLASGDEVSFEPASLVEVTAETPRGRFILGCRLIDPVTRELRYESIQAVDIQ